MAAATSRATSIASAHAAARPGPHQPSASSWPVQHGGDVERLVGQRSVERGELLVARPVVDPRPRDRQRVPRLGQEDAAGLEHREVGEAPAEVALAPPPGARAAGSCAGRAPRRRAGWRAAPCAGAGRRLASPSVVEGRGADEGVAAHLGEPGRGEGPGHEQSVALRRAEPGAGGCRPQHRRHPFVALEPDDLLGEVVRVGEVGAPGRRRHGQDAVGRRDRRPRTRRRRAGGGRPRRGSRRRRRVRRAPRRP